MNLGAKRGLQLSVLDNSSRDKLSLASKHRVAGSIDTPMFLMPNAQISTKHVKLKTESVPKSPPPYVESEQFLRFVDNKHNMDKEKHMKFYPTESSLNMQALSNKVKQFSCVQAQRAITEGPFVKV